MYFCYEVSDQIRYKTRRRKVHCNFIYKQSMASILWKWYTEKLREFKEKHMCRSLSFLSKVADFWQSRPWNKWNKIFKTRFLLVKESGIMVKIYSNFTNFQYRQNHGRIVTFRFTAKICENTGCHRSAFSRITEEYGSVKPSFSIYF